MKKLIAGNWKMNGTLESSVALASFIGNGIRTEPDLTEKCDFLVCPPFVYLQAVADIVDSHEVAVGGQDCSDQDDGAYTGDVSTAMLKDLECEYVILGHSERRQYHQESNDSVQSKAQKALIEGLKVIICVGETLEQREDGQAEEVVGSQLAGSLPHGATSLNTVIAYEPVWAIGTGKSATADDIKAMHAFIREKLDNNADFRILYGGSVKPGNAGEILSIPNVDGALIGGASLHAEDFLNIAKAA